MADIIGKPFSYLGNEGSDNLDWGNDCHDREAVLQDKLADCLFQMESENAGGGMLDELLSQLDEAAPLPNDKSLDTENSLTKFYQKFQTVSATPDSPTASQRYVYRYRPLHPFPVKVILQRYVCRPFRSSPVKVVSQCNVYQPFIGVSSSYAYRRGVLWANSFTYAAVIGKTIRWNKKK